jgi:hypothetical protein
MLIDDYKDMLSELAAANAEYLLVGAFAMAAHMEPDGIPLCCTARVCGTSGPRRRTSCRPSGEFIRSAGAG